MSPGRWRTLALLLIGLAAALAGCGGDDEGSGSAGDSTGQRAQTGGAASGDGCEQVEAPAPKAAGRAKKPSKPLDSAKEYEVTVSTTCGEFRIALNTKASPETAASFVALARSGFYEGTIFHRIVPGFVIQGGDPTGTGTGGPGYKTVDKPAGDARYTKGVAAMAKAGNEAPGTAGSQFFVVVGEDAGLPPEYAVLGRVTNGLDTVERIGQLGDPATEQPIQTVVIEDATVRSS